MDVPMKTIVAVLFAASLTACAGSPRRCRPCPAPRAIPVATLPAKAAPDAGLRTLEAGRVLESKRVKELRLDGASLDQVASYLRTVTGLDFLVTPRLRAERFEEVKVSLVASDLAVVQVLDVVTAQHGLDWEIRDGVVTIGLPEEVPGASRIRHRFFDVKDLVGSSSPEARDAALEALRTEIRKTVDPASWAREGAAIEHKNGVLVVKNSRRNLDDVGRVLEARRSSGR